MATREPRRAAGAPRAERAPVAGADAAGSGADGHFCPRCGRTLPASDFTPNPHLAGGLAPWCRDCSAARRTPDADRADVLATRDAYAREYQRLYQAKCRVDKGPPPARPRWRVRLGRGRTGTLTRVASKGRVVLRCGWRAREAARKLLVEGLGCDAENVDLAGRGAGRGTREQRWAVLTAGMGEDEWSVGIGNLEAEGAAEAIQRTARR